MIYVVQIVLYWLFLKWLVANLASNGQSLGLSFSGSFWAYFGWSILAVISVITIIGWAWVYTAMMRWICSNIQGTRREVVFTGTGLEMLWRTIVLFIGFVLHHPDPVGVSLDVPVARVANRTGRARRAGPRIMRQALRWRTEPSCATEATSVPSGLKIRPRVRPRPSCALGESCA